MAVKFPYDPLGVDPKCLVKDDVQSVQPPADIKKSTYIVPTFAPFHKEDLEIWTGPNKTGTRLVPDKDYMLAIKFDAATVFLGRPFYGGIIFKNATYTGTVYVTGRTLGGDFVQNDLSTIEKILSTLNRDIRYVPWDQLFEVPSMFPPGAHEHVVGEVITFENIGSAIDRVADAILAMGGGGSGNDSAAMQLIQGHIANKTNAHTPAAVGLGNVRNYAIATNQEAVDGRGDRYMTPATTIYLIRRAITDLDIPTIAQAIHDLQENIAVMKVSIEALQRRMADLDQRISINTAAVEALERRQAALGTDLAEVAQKADLAQQTAAIAVNAANTTQTNLDDFSDQMNAIVHVSTEIFPVGSYHLILPPRNKIKVTMVGGGGASGEYYQDTAAYVPLASALSRGEDSVLYYLGTRAEPVEPVPLIVAGGGEPGGNGLGERGAVLGGLGGVGKYFRKTTLKASEINKIDLLKDLVDVPIANNGATGRTGDTHNSLQHWDGAGGWTINASGNETKRTYGRGNPGNSRAGTGGGAAKVELLLDNDTTESIRIAVVVGKGGDNGRKTIQSDVNQYIKRLEIDGVCIVQLA